MCFLFYFWGFVVLFLSVQLFAFLIGRIFFLSSQNIFPFQFLIVLRVKKPFRNVWTWVWVNSGSWWWIGRPGVLRFMGSQRVGHDWATELNWNIHLYFLLLFYSVMFSKLFYPRFSFEVWCNIMMSVFTVVNQLS